MTSTPLAEPMPWPGYEPPPAAGLLAWGWADGRLREARRFWLASTHADGSAHLRAIWAAWVDGRLAFSTGRETRKARNLVADGRCSIAAEHGDDSLVVEGAAGELTDRAAIERADAVYTAKYGSSMLVGDSPVFAVRPRLVIGFHEDDPAVRPTRWRF